MQKALPQHWTNIAIGKTNYKICAVANSRDKWIAVQLVIYGTDALENFRRLKNKWEADSKEKISDKLEWIEKDGGKEHHVNLRFNNHDPLNEKKFDEQHSILIKCIEEFYVYFKEKVRKN